MTSMWLLLIFSCHFIFTDGELFSALADFEALFSEEHIVTEAIANYIEKRQQKLDILKKFAEDRKITENSNDQIFNHPLTLFRTTKRWTSDWENVKSMLNDQSDADEAMKNVTARRQQYGIQFPTDDDLTGTVVGLFRLQDTYQLEARDLANGKINGAKVSSKLTALDCFDIGMTSVRLSTPDYYHALLWFQEALDRLQIEKEQGGESSVEETTVLDYLSYAMYQQGNVERAWFLAKRLRSIDPTNENVNENMRYYADELKSSGIDIYKVKESQLHGLKLTRPPRDMGGYDEFSVYERLCRGESVIKPDHSSKLYCYYKNNRPFLRLAPLKAELIHLKPKIILFRSIVSETESQMIRELGKPKLSRAMISRSDGTLETAAYRISKRYTSFIRSIDPDTNNGWLADAEHGVIARVSKRVDDMTDLTTKTAEFLQKHEKGSFKMLGTGNRIATVLFYLSQPEAGGATIFPKLELTLYPTKNDAVVWFNLYKSGEGDLSTRHAACPVLSGIKWVANKWLHEHGQEFLRPCGLDENEYE